MPEQTPPVPPSEPEPPSPGKQNLIIGIFYGAIVALALFVAYLELQPQDSDGDNTSVIPVNPADPKDPANPTNPSIPISTDIPEISDTRQRAMKTADRLGSDAASLVGMIAQLSEKLDLAEEELAGIRTLYASASLKLRKLEDEAAISRLKSGEIELLQSQLAEAQTLLDLSDRRAEALMAKLATSPDPATLREAQAMRDAFEAELRNTKIRLAQDEVEKARLRAELGAVTTELAASESALESTSLFLDSIDLLPDSAKQLFLELSRLETVDRDELEKNYQLINQKIGARVVDTIPFLTGSSKVDPVKALSIREAIDVGKSDSFFLVIRYASKTGNFDLNKKLSSERATAVATLAAEIAKPDQMIRAVFLGQTDRFSDTNVLDDQICELWEVPK